MCCDLCICSQYSPSVCGWDRKTVRSGGISPGLESGIAWSFEKTASRNKQDAQETPEHRGDQTEEQCSWWTNWNLTKHSTSDITVGDREQWRTTYHPRFAAEIVDGIKRVDTWDPAEMKADHKVPEVLAGNHAVGMLTDEDKVRLEGPEGRQSRKLNSGYIAWRWRWYWTAVI